MFQLRSHKLSPGSSSGELADELALAAMTKSLRALSTTYLGNMYARASAYYASRIPAYTIHRLDKRAVEIECYRRSVMATHGPHIEESPK